MVEINSMHCTAYFDYMIHTCIYLVQVHDFVLGDVLIIHLTQEPKCSWLTCSNIIDRYHSDSDVLKIRMVNGVKQGSVLYELRLILSTGCVSDGDIVAQDGYPLQSERRTPRDENRNGVEGGHSDVTD